MIHELNQLKNGSVKEEQDVGHGGGDGSKMSKSWRIQDGKMSKRDLGESPERAKNSVGQKGIPNHSNRGRNQGEESSASETSQRKGSETPSSFVSGDARSVTVGSK